MLDLHFFSAVCACRSSVFRVRPVRGEHRDAGLAGQAQLRGVRAERCRKDAARPVDDGARDVVLRAGFGDDRDDLVESHPRRATRVAQRLHQPADQRLQHLIADVAAEGIVDVLEAVDVEHDEREIVLAARGRFEIRAEPLQQQRAVRKTGERIVIGEIVEPLRLHDVIERERHVACELAQQLDLALVEEADFVVVQREHRRSPCRRR